MLQKISSKKCNRANNAIIHIFSTTALGTKRHDNSQSRNWSHKPKVHCFLNASGSLPINPKSTSKESLCPSLRHNKSTFSSQVRWSNWATLYRFKRLNTDTCIQVGVRILCHPWLFFTAQMNLNTSSSFFFFFLHLTCRASQLWTEGCSIPGTWSEVILHSLLASTEKHLSHRNDLLFIGVVLCSNYYPQVSSAVV